MADKNRMSGITNMMLTKSLRELEEAGLVSRHQYDSVPPKVEYSLTDTGKDLLPTLNELYKWGQKQMKKQDETARRMNMQACPFSSLPSRE